MAQYHPSKTLNIGGEEVEVDLKLVPMVQRMNDLGYRTVCSCEHHNHVIPEAPPFFLVGVDPVEDAIFICQQFAYHIGDKQPLSARYGNQRVALIMNVKYNGCMSRGKLQTRGFLEGPVELLPRFEEFVLSSLTKKGE